LVALVLFLGDARQLWSVESLEFEPMRAGKEKLITLVPATVKYVVAIVLEHDDTFGQGLIDFQMEGVALTKKLFESF
jgi:hypothetical protein